MTTPPARTVLDSNVWISALISPQGNSAAIMRRIVGRVATGIISAPIISEVDRGLA